MRRRLIGFGLLGACLWFGSAGAADAVNVYRYLLGQDLPTAVSFEALGGPGRVLDRGSAPRPFMLTGGITSGADAGTAAMVAVDFSPWWFVGGGVRTLEEYRSNSIAGRLMRVLTKTVFSVAVDNSRFQQRLGLGIRSTLHDPHDAVLNSKLPEELDGSVPPAESLPLGEDDLALTPGMNEALISSARAMRRRGGIQISAGYSLALESDSSSSNLNTRSVDHHSFSLTGQITAGARFDLLVRGRSQFAEGDLPRPAAALGVLRKSAGGDILLGLWVERGMAGPRPLAIGSLRVARHVAIRVELLGRGSEAADSAGPITALASVQLFPAADRP